MIRIEGKFWSHKPTEVDLENALDSYAAEHNWGRLRRWWEGRNYSTTLKLHKVAEVYLPLERAGRVRVEGVEEEHLSTDRKLSRIGIGGHQS